MKIGQVGEITLNSKTKQIAIWAVVVICVLFVLFEIQEFAHLRLRG